MDRPQFQRIEVGDVIEVKDNLGESSLWTMPHMRKWTVKEIYPHHIVCLSDGTTTSFTFGEMVQLGYEVVPQYDTKDEPARHWFME